MTTRIIAADDHQVLREGLCALLNQQPDLDVVGQTGSGREAIQMTRDLLPDLVLMDIHNVAQLVKYAIREGLTGIEQ